MSAQTRQEHLDRFYVQNGPCCAGCDWWQSVTSLVGECGRSAPVGTTERFSMLGMTGSSFQPEAGQIMTRREHKCGEFKDDFDWTQLPPAYLRRIGGSPKQEASHDQ